MMVRKVPDIKDFMDKLFQKEVFDSFLLVSFELTSYANILIDGIKNPSPYEEEGSERYLYWREIKDRVFGLVRGNRGPDKIKAVFMLSEKQAEKVLRKIGFAEGISDKGLFFNLKYENRLLQLTTGVSCVDFFTGKSLEKQWDEDFMKFLTYYEIATEAL